MTVAVVIALWCTISVALTALYAAWRGWHKRRAAAFAGASASVVPSSAERQDFGPGPDPLPRG